MPKRCIPIPKYDTMLIEIAEGTKAMIEAETYKNQNAKLKVELAAKEERFIKSNDKSAMAHRLVDTLQSQVISLKNVNEMQAKIIGKQGKPKYWNLSIGAGYGFQLGSTVTSGFQAGIFIGRSIARF